MVEEPDHLMCPITHVMFRDPVVNRFGHTYEREALKQALRVQLRDPLTNQPLPPNGGLVFVNRAVAREVDEFLERNSDYLPQGWPNRTRDVAVDTTQVEEMREFQQQQAWGIRLRCPVNDLVSQVCRFMREFMLRPRKLLPPLDEHPSRTARLVGLCVFFFADMPALLGGRTGLNLIFGMLRTTLGICSPFPYSIADITGAIQALGAVLKDPAASISLLNHPLRMLSPSKGPLLENCLRDLNDLHKVSLCLSNGSKASKEQLLDFLHSKQVTFAKWVLSLASLHIRLGGEEVGYKTALLDYTSRSSVPRALAHGCIASARFGLIAGCGYALLVLYVRACITLLAQLLLVRA